MKGSKISEQIILSVDLEHFSTQRIEEVKSFKNSLVKSKSEKARGSLGNKMVNFSLNNTKRHFSAIPVINGTFNANLNPNINTNINDHSDLKTT